MDSRQRSLSREWDVEQVIVLPEGESDLRRLLAPEGVEGGHARHRAFTIAVTGGCGGAGASVLAAALARSAAQVTASLLIDCDPLGSGADLLFGAEDEPGLRWPELVLARGPLVAGSLSGVLPLMDGVRVLSWDRAPTPTPVPPEAVTSVVEAARQESDVVILDLPRTLDAPAAAAARAADLTLLVVPAQTRAATSARRGLAALQECCADVQLVVRTLRPPCLPADVIAEALELPLAGALSPEPGLRVSLEHGEPPGLRRRGPLGRLSHDILKGRVVATGFEADRLRAPGPGGRLP
jgi:secretion/DNA translocation related CpaE-like protein